MVCLLAIALFAGVAASAQASWKLKLDNKVLLSATEESMEKNVVKMTGLALKKAKVVTLHYGEVGESKDWQRTIMLYSPEDEALKTFKGNRFSLPAAALQKLFAQSKTIHVYTMSLPKDPKLAATVRVRRVHLCTLVLN